MSKIVYSTDPALQKRCPCCKELEISCTCAPAPKVVEAPTVAKLRIEKSGRGGKAVTVVFDLPNDPVWLKELAGKLKKACGVGGTAGEGRVEIQGDQREKLREILPKLGFTTVKG
jgi:translation initiation factor 1